MNGHALFGENVMGANVPPPLIMPLTPPRLDRMHVSTPERVLPSGPPSNWSAEDVEMNFGPLLRASDGGSSKSSSPRLAPGGSSPAHKMMASLVELEVDSNKRRKEKKASLDELLTTEETYRDQLCAVIETLQAPLKQYVDEPLNRSGLVFAITGGADHEDVVALHRAFAPLPAAELVKISSELVQSLRRRIVTYEDATVMIGDVFASLASKVRDAMCTWYDWHERADAELRRIVAKSSKVKNLVDRAGRDSRCKDAQVSSLLIAPTQRLVRQMLFLERLHKTTPDQHPDASQLAKAHDVWKDILEACNQVAGNHAMQRRAEALERVLDAAPPSVVVTAPGRFLTHEGSLTKIGANTVRPDYFFLFETLSATELLHTAAPDANGRFGFKRFLRVLHIEDVELINGETDDAATGAVRRSAIYGASRFAGLGGGSGNKLVGGGGPSSNDPHNNANQEQNSLLLRVVCAYPSDPKNGRIYSLAGDRDTIVDWKSKVTKALGKNTAEWKLRFKGDVTVLGEGFGDFPCAEVTKDRDSFMWFFSGRFGGMIVRASTGKANSGKLAWHESLRVETVDPDVPPLHMIRGDKLKKRIKQPNANEDVFRIVCYEKTLVVASDEKDLIVELMKPPNGNIYGP